MKYSRSWAFPDDNLHFKGNYWPIISALRILEQKCWLRLAWVRRESVRECERACSRLGLDPPLIPKFVWIPSCQRPGFLLDLSWGPETAASLIDQKKGFVNGTQTQTRVALAQPFRCPPVQGWWRPPPRPWDPRPKLWTMAASPRCSALTWLPVRGLHSRQRG